MVNLTKLIENFKWKITRQVFTEYLNKLFDDLHHLNVENCINKNKTRKEQ